MEKYDKDIGNAPAGKVYQECCNLQKRKPNEDYIRLYNEIKEELSEMGIKFKG